MPTRSRALAAVVCTPRFGLNARQPARRSALLPRHAVVLRIGRSVPRRHPDRTPHPSVPDEIRCTDPALARTKSAHPMPHGSAAHCAATAAASPTPVQLSNSTLLPLSPAAGLDFIATVQMHKVPRSAASSSWKTRRYDPQNLAAALDTVGWSTDLTLPYGQSPDGQPTMALMLFQTLNPARCQRYQQKPARPTPAIVPHYNQPLRPVMSQAIVVRRLQIFLYFSSPVQPAQSKIVSMVN